MTVIAERSMEISGQPARVVVDLRQRSEAGVLQTSSIWFKVYRDLPDGRAFVQVSDVIFPGVFKQRALSEQDAIVDSSGWFDEEGDAACAVAAAALPADPDFPADRPMGFEQLCRLLG